MRKKPRSQYKSNVFINCPFDTTYDRLFYAIVFTVHFGQFKARCSKELNDSGDRLGEIVRLIGNCAYGIHDISRVQPRYNMAFELGLDMGFKMGGNRKYARKKHLILTSRKYKYRQCLSDLAGVDEAVHSNRIDGVIQVVRNWLNGVRGRKRHPLPSGESIHAEYRKFRRKLPEMCEKSKLTLSNITFTDYCFMVAQFIKDRAAQDRAKSRVKRRHR